MKNNHQLLHRVDLVVFSLANLFNLLMVIIFLGRTGDLPKIGFTYVIWALFIVILSGVVWINFQNQRSWWLVVLPIVMILFLILEIILDNILQLNFRNSALLGPYLALYYLALFGMIGYSFLIGKGYGLFTLVTYFLNQAATFYAYFLVGHG